MRQNASILWSRDAVRFDFERRLLEGWQERATGTRANALWFEEGEWQRDRSILR